METSNNQRGQLGLACDVPGWGEDVCRAGKDEMPGEA